MRYVRELVSKPAISLKKVGGATVEPHTLYAGLNQKHDNLQFFYAAFVRCFAVREQTTLALKFDTYTDLTRATMEAARFL